jgi:hypothetical protein
MNFCQIFQLSHCVGKERKNKMAAGWSVHVVTVAVLLGCSCWAEGARYTPDWPSLGNKHQLKLGKTCTAKKSAVNNFVLKQVYRVHRELFVAHFRQSKSAKGVSMQKGVTKRCRLSWLINRALVYEPKCGGWGEERVSANEYSCTQEPK